MSLSAAQSVHEPSVARIPSAQKRVEKSGAVTLRDTVGSSMRYMARQKFDEKTAFWCAAIDGKIDTPEACAVRNWYENELAAHSYSVPDWQVTPENAALFEKFRSDEYYHLKNIIEISARTVVEERLRKNGVDCRLFLSSEFDDVKSWVDFIAEITLESGGKWYVGIDLFISATEWRIEAKEVKREMSMCHEFNKFRRLKGEKNGDGKYVPFAMERIVEAISPKAMGLFLPEFMKRIELGDVPFPSEALAILDQAENPTVSMVKEATVSQVSQLIH